MALSLLPGSIALILARTALGAVPVLLVAMGGMEAAGVLGLDPRFADAETPWPFFQAFHASWNAVDGAHGAMPLAALIVFLGKLYLDAAATGWFAGRATGEAGTFWGTVFGEGWHGWWAMFRLSVLTLVLLAAGGFVVMAIVGAVSALNAGPTVYDQVVVMPSRLGLALLIWLLLVGNWAVWAKAHLAVSGRKRALTALPLGIVGAFQRPLSSLLTFVLLPLPTIGTALLISWLRVFETGTGLGACAYVAIGLAGAFLHAVVWRTVLAIAVSRRASQLEGKTLPADPTPSP